MTTHNPQDPGTQELNPAERNTPPNEVPTPEQQTGDAQRMPPKEAAENNPAQPPSDRA